MSSSIRLRSPLAPSRTETASLAVGRVQYCLLGNGPVVMVLHGSPGGCDQSVLLYRELLEHGYALLAPSRPGFLATPLSVGESVTQQAEAMIQLADHLGIQRFFVAGFSCGGPCAIELAAAYPERICGLVLESAVTKPYLCTLTRGVGGMFVKSSLGGALIQSLVSLMPRTAMEMILAAEGNLPARAIKQDVGRILADDALRREAFAFLSTCMPSVHRRDGLLNDVAQQVSWNAQRVGDVACPTLIIHGDADKDVPIEHAHHAAQTAPNAQLFIASGASHLLKLAPSWAAVVQKRVEFLASLADVQASNC